MPTSLDGLPVELISQVICFIDSKSDLISLARCSQQLHAMTVPYLYADIAIIANDLPRSAYEQYGELTPYYYLRMMACCFFRHPEYARHVRQLTLRWDEETDYHEPVKVAIEPEIEEAIKVLTVGGFITKSLMYDVKHIQNVCVILALLLGVLDHLERLDLHTYPVFESFTHSVEQYLRWGDIKCCEELTDVMVVCPGNPFLPLQSHGFWFTSPTIRSISFFKLSSDVASWEEVGCWENNLRSLKPKSSTVEHLELRAAWLNKEEVLSILGAPKALKSFIFEYRFIGPGYLSCPDILRALMQHRDSLEDLCLSWWECYTHDSHADEVGDVIHPLITPLESFADLQKLKRLRIDMAILLGEAATEDASQPDIDEHRLADALPPQLELLHLTHVQDSFIEAVPMLEQVLQRKRTNFASLREIVLEAPFATEKGLWTDTQALLRLAKELGIQLTLLHNYHNLTAEGPKGPERGWGMDEEVRWEEIGDDCNKRPVFDVVELQH